RMFLSPVFPMRLPILIAMCCLAAPAGSAIASVPVAGGMDAAALRSFFATYCQECHGPEKQKADRRFDELQLPVANADTLIELQDIIDQLNLGEMPPAEATQHPATPDVQEAVAVLTKMVTDGHARLSSTDAQTVLR